MEEYKSNSYKSKEKQKESPKVEKVVTGAVKVKKNEMRKFTDVFISEDANKVKDYILMDVLVPAVKKAISDIITNGIDMILYGESGRTVKKSNASNVSYRNFYDQRRYDERRYVESRPTTRYRYDDIILESRGEAEEVLTRMDELIDSYGQVRVADFYDLVGITGDFTDNKYGWTNLHSAEVIRVRDGYKIKLSRPVPID